ncbi:MAG: hypothetical protein WD766_01765 [Gemmatimonadota bacterium]
MTMIRTALAVLLLCAAVAHPSGAQQRPPETPVVGGVTERAAAMPDPRIMLLGGATAHTNRMHATAGLAARLGRAGWGAMALGVAGRGGEYDSLMLGAAATRRLLRGGRWSVSAFAGYATYEESGATGIERDSAGLLAGGFGTVSLGPVALVVFASDLVGSYDEPDVPDSFGFHVPRIAIGLAF